MSFRPARILPFVAAGIYIASFFLPALYCTGKASTAGQSTYISGAGALFDGFWAMFDRQYAWLANPVALGAVILLWRRVWAVAFLLALGALAMAQQTWVVVGTLISGDEGGVTKYLVTSLGPGFYLWCFSFLLLVVASLVLRREPVGDQADR